jgi:hypothetical protein
MPDKYGRPTDEENKEFYSLLLRESLDKSIQYLDRQSRSLDDMVKQNNFNHFIISNVLKRNRE